ncbi:hypothetical protein TSUD_138940 [Trifolium subterraneum]|uniref:Uncharacterized protein n=1 Tax=Trifolium subterraneum TaxID=3900 RepID=A0A2Z6PDM8_TRISU|nr:hypothetical protein TSUD_138940 [Trifolium subterraneum]
MSLAASIPSFTSLTTDASATQSMQSTATNHIIQLMGVLQYIQLKNYNEGEIELQSVTKESFNSCNLHIGEFRVREPLFSTKREREGTSESDERERELERKMSEFEFKSDGG